MLILRILCPGGQQIAQVNAYRIAADFHFSIRKRELPCLLRTAQTQILPDIKQEQVDGRPVQTAGPVPGREIIFDVHVLTGNRQRVEDQISQCLIYIRYHLISPSTFTTCRQAPHKAETVTAAVAAAEAAVAAAAADCCAAAS